MTKKNVFKLFGFFTLRQDETGVVLTLGKFSRQVQPGLSFAVPFLQQAQKTMSSLQTIDLPDQQIVLAGNVSVTISGNLNFRVENASKALLEVSDYSYTVQRLALTTIADVLGTKTIEEVRTSKVAIADEIETIVAERAREWGLADVDIRLTDARMDEGLLRAMMRETEAHKEAAAIKIKADGDLKVAQKFAAAAKILADAPGAMTLRVLQTVSDVSSDKSTIIVPLPIDLLTRAFGNDRGRETP